MNRYSNPANLISKIHTFINKGMNHKQTISNCKNTPDLFKEVVKNSNSCFDLCTYYKVSYSGQNIKLFKDLILFLNISTDHWHKRKRTYQRINKTCPVCKKLYETLLNHKREKQCCSRSCSNSLFKRRTKSNKPRKKYKPYKNPKICKICKAEYFKTNKYYCSLKCAAVFRKTDEDYKNKLRNAQISLIQQGKHKGWASRNKASYAERFFIKVLTNHNINYEFELKCGKYFIDFAIKDKMIALEIDGKQHLYEDRMIKDKEKDKYLENAGWKVYRIPWKSINNVLGKEYIKNEIKKFIDYYKSL